MRQLVLVWLNSCITSVWRVRVRAGMLFLSLLIMFGAIAPTASAIATNNVHTLSPHTPPSAPHASKPVDTTTRMKQDYAGALPTGSSKVKLAADANKGVFDTSQDNPLSASTTDGPGKKQKAKHEEVAGKRTANTATFDLGNGKAEVRTYAQRINYKVDGQWQKIDDHVVEDTNAAESTNPFGKALAFAKGKVQTLHTYKLAASDWQAKFAASNDGVGMVRIEAGGKKLAFSPEDAHSVVPTVETKNGIQTVTYKNLWPNVDVMYSVRSDALKEEIILKSADVKTNFAYAIVGADLQANKDGGFTIAGTDQTLAPLSVSTQLGGPTSENVIAQSYKNGTLAIKLDGKWLTKQSADQFPVVIDPTWQNTGNVSWNYTAYKSDGYVCSSSACYMDAGTVNDGGWKYWRTPFRVDFNFLQGKQLLGASMHLQQANRGTLTGYNGNRYFTVSHANCIGYNCIDGGAPQPQTLINYTADVDMYNLLQSRINAGDWGAWFMITGEEGGYTSWKGFDADLSYLATVYSTVPAAPTVVTPQNNQTFVDPQVSFQLNPVGDTDGDHVQYYYRIATGSDGETGTVINSGDVDSTQWTVPDGVLQDGMTYYLHAYSRDPYAYSAPSAPIKFTINARLGKDKTQTYDAIGPVNVDLTNGNVSTGVSSHATSALGGDLGVSLDYNSPLRSRAGLVGSYWKNGSESGNPALTRVDKNIQFNWDLGSPSAGVIDNDNFSAQWNGYFVASAAGTYYFGGSNDDGMTVTVNGQVVYNQTCYSGVCYDMSKSTTLTLGQVVPIKIDYVEATGSAYANLYVKGAVSEQVVPQAWLQTAARPIAQPQGLIGSYYANNAGYNLDATGKQLLARRTDTTLSFDWGTGGPVPGGTADFMARWTGYIKLTGGNYIFGTTADDGARIKIGSTTVADNYSTCCSEQYGSSTHFNSGVYPIQIDYYDVGGPAALSVLVKANGATTGQIVPSAWLSPSAQTLPAGWQLGIDPDGNLSYDHMSVGISSATLSDSGGNTHVYTWTGDPGSTGAGSYKPPVNEDGQLVRNNDGTFTLIDVDGRTYVFKADGTLASVTNPVDDRKPAALQYTYAGTPAHITKIADGVDTSRYAGVYYSGDGQGKCAAAPGSSYLDPADDSINGYICAVQTNDGRTTSFFYSMVGGVPELSLVIKPGNERTSYQYDANGMMTAVRGSLAEDVVAAGVRANDATTMSKIDYDFLGRATGVTAPAAMSGDTRQARIIGYYPGYTLEHVVGATEPNGYSRRVDYDSTFRTTKDTDVTGNATLQQWDSLKDLLYSVTGPSGLMSTITYDDEDRPTNSYGPAPQSWFNTTDPKNQTPLNVYASQVAHATVSYDQGIVGPSVAWYNYTSANGGSLVGAPKLHTTGFDATSPGHLGRSFVSNPAPITPDSGMDGYGFTATGKLRLPSTGTYTFHLYTDDSAKLSIDDAQILGNWGTTTTGIAQNTLTGTFNATAGVPYRFNFQYGHSGADGGLELWISGPGITDTNGGLGTSQFSSYLSPDYSLPTSATTYDSILGNATVTNNYGSNPELGLAQSTSIDPSGLNLTTSNTYETQGASDSFLRGMSTNLPGNPTANPSYVYSYYGATETRDNPCTTTVEAFKQAGRLKTTTSADPDGAGSQTAEVSEVIYDDAGRAVATRANSDDWTCTTYDSRGRVNTVSIPAYNGQAARTVSNDYAVGGSPLETTTWDGSGWVVKWTDLLGRTTKYRDVHDDETATTYDNFGNVSQAISPVGTVTYDYDSYGRMTDEKLDGTVYATIHYDPYNRVDHIDYNNAPGMSLTPSRDSLGRTDSLTYGINSSTPGSNLVANPSLETATSGQPAGWSQGNWGANTTSFTYATNGHTGTHSANIDMTSYTNGDAKWYFTPVNITGGSNYTFSDYYKSTVSTSVFVQYTYADNSTTYQWIGDPAASSSSWAQATYNFTAPATATKATIFHLIDSVGSLQIDDMSMGLTRQPVSISDTITLTQSGKVKTDEVQSGSSILDQTYGYDGAGRLTTANIGPHTYSYGYGTQNATACGTGNGMNANSGKNGNRTSQSVDGATTYYCYNYADQLVSSTAATANGAQYDSHGNITQLGTGAAPLRLSYDSSDRNWALVQYDASGNGNADYYSRDVAGRIVSREHDNIAAWNWSLNNSLFYGYTGDSGSPSFVRDANWDVVEKTLSLPGGVTLTIYPKQTGNNQQQYSLPSALGHTLLTTNAAGVNTSTGNGPLSSFTYDPFGNIITGSSNPSNTSDASYGYGGAHKLLTEIDLASAPIQMGARVYLASIGRFTSMDPIPGGNANAYVYVLDPINFADYKGTSGSCAILCVSSLNLQPAIGVAVLQPSVSASRVIYSSAATAQIRLAPTVAKAAAKPAAAVPAVVNMHPVDLTKLVPTNPLQGGLATGGGAVSFNFINAASAAQSGYEAGGIAGATVGCGAGALYGSVVPGLGTAAGCLLGLSYGAFGGGVGLGIWGFIHGGTTNSDPLDTGSPFTSSPLDELR